MAFRWRFSPTNQSLLTLGCSRSSGEDRWVSDWSRLKHLEAGRWSPGPAEDDRTLVSAQRALLIFYLRSFYTHYIYIIWLYIYNIWLYIYIWLSLSLYIYNYIYDYMTLHRHSASNLALNLKVSKPILVGSTHINGLCLLVKSMVNLHFLPV